MPVNIESSGLCSQEQQVPTASFAGIFKGKTLQKLSGYRQINRLSAADSRQIVVNDFKDLIQPCGGKLPNGCGKLLK